MRALFTAIAVLFMTLAASALKHPFTFELPDSWSCVTSGDNPVSYLYFSPEEPDVIIVVNAYAVPEEDMYKLDFKRHLDVAEFPDSERITQADEIKNVKNNLFNNGYYRTYTLDDNKFVIRKVFFYPGKVFVIIGTGPLGDQDEVQKIISSFKVETSLGDEFSFFSINTGWPMLTALLLFLIIMAAVGLNLASNLIVFRNSSGLDKKARNRIFINLAVFIAWIGVIVWTMSPSPKIMWRALFVYGGIFLAFALFGRTKFFRGLIKGFGI